MLAFTLYTQTYLRKRKGGAGLNNRSSSFPPSFSLSFPAGYHALFHNSDFKHSTELNRHNS